MTTSPFDLPQAHRWFAIEFNNLAWDLAEAPTRTPEDVERMLLAAHAARWHWLQVGTPLNHQRGYLLLAYASALAQLADSALHYAERCIKLSESLEDELTPFDRAMTYDTAARAYRLAGHQAAAQQWLKKSRAAAEQLTEAADREVFNKLRLE